MRRFSLSAVRYPQIALVYLNAIAALSTAAIDERGKRKADCEQRNLSIQCKNKAPVFQFINKQKLSI